VAIRGAPVERQPTSVCRGKLRSLRYHRVMSLLDRISIDPEVVHGRPVVRGTRMRVADVLALLAAGADEDEILRDYPYLAPEDIKACLAYAAAQADHAVLTTS
jgi:uncharacterized protein (DUF433 family)